MVKTKKPDPATVTAHLANSDPDWAKLIDTRYIGGFDGVLSIEHEDPMWGGTPEKVEAGLEVARRTLRPLMVM